ncbi:competence type IV pilus minor pilin ComGF [Bacillus salacetis]|uniref:competence type IV pilus minor pilin ComGF n=1 Tax=Bacillus salacetis TaxID=2315464 RepID=UPI003BA1676F
MKSQAGYTLLHAVFTLCIFLLIASCMPPIISGIALVENKLAPSKEYEWNLFSHQFRLEFRGAKDIKVNDSSVIFIKNGEEILYEKYGDYLRRRVDRRGHEIVLGPLNALELKTEENGIEILASFEDEVEVGRFFTYGQ